MTNILDLFESDIKTIDVSNKNLNGIINLNRFKNLKRINCSNNQLVDIDLFNLEWVVTELDCENNLITEFIEIPNSITRLNIKFNPLKKLIFNPESEFNLPLETLGLPECLTHLKFGLKFNHSINWLPSSLIVLTLGDNFNFPIKNLPPKLKYLTIGDSFNKPLLNLPDELVYIDLGLSFNKRLIDLPENLYWLSLSKNYTKLSQIKLPKSIECLFIGNYNQENNLIKSI